MPTFQATCSGTVTCQVIGACADWQYDVSDDGTNTTVTGSVTMLVAGSPPECSASGTDSNQSDAGHPGSIDIPCAQGTWTLWLDRETSTVYIHADDGGPSDGMDWTQPCK